MGRGWVRSGLSVQGRGALSWPEDGRGRGLPGEQGWDLTWPRRRLVGEKGSVRKGNSGSWLHGGPVSPTLVCCTFLDAALRPPQAEQLHFLITLHILHILALERLGSALLP